MRYLNVVRYNLAVLAANWDIHDARLLDPRLLKVFRLVEPDLIIKQDDVLSFDPLKDILFALATSPFTHLELKRKLLSFARIIVAPDLQMFSVNALELFLVCLDLLERRLKNGVDQRFRSTDEPKLLIRAVMVIEWDRPAPELILLIAPAIVLDNQLAVLRLLDYFPHPPLTLIGPSSSFLLLETGNGIIAP